MAYLKSSRGLKKSTDSESAFPSIQSFLDEVEGVHAISKILISNNGNAAVKFIQSVRRWSYEVFGNDKMIQFVAMATPDDILANSEFVRMVDKFIQVPGGSNNNNYANVDLIVDIAERTNSDAVWAGWGHASENPRLPESLAERNIIFIGPPGSAMRSLGDKISSSILAQSANVSSLPWNGMDIKLDLQDVQIGEVVEIPEEVYNRGLITNVKDGIAASKRIGYPVMIKASEGGGGKGIRKVECEEDFAAQFNQVQAEVAGSPIFVMKLATDVRHIEVQLLADNYGNAISLFTRDCSVQRRHQKILEEAPASVGTYEQFRIMEKAAVRLAKLVGYVNLGTVEYLFNADNGYWFLELNPRLQVEHPCTEMITDINLPAVQLQVAMGIPLHRIPDIRMFYGLERYDNTPIDFDRPEHEPRPKGHVIAARITAENPDEGFKPTSGRIEELNFRSIKNVWGYFSVSAGGSIHEYADSQFGHVFAWGENRDVARTNLVVALKNLSIRGDISTSVEYLVKLLEAEDFADNQISTAWLDDLIRKNVKPDRPDIILAVICASLFVGSSNIDRLLNQYRAALKRGQVLGIESIERSSTTELIYENVRYICKTTLSGKDKYVIEMNGSFIETTIHKLIDGGRLISFGDSSYVTYLKEDKSKYRVEVNGKTIPFMKEDDPSALRSTSPGKLVRYLVEDGSYVSQGMAYAEVEVMKMLFSLFTPESGVIHFTRTNGAILESGDVVAKIDLEDPSKIQNINTYENGFPLMESENSVPKANHLFEEAYLFFENELNGYCLPGELFASKLKFYRQILFRSLKDKSLPLLQIQSILASISGRIPADLEDTISELLKQYSEQMGSVFCSFPGQKIEEAINLEQTDSYAAALEPIIQLLHDYENGLRGFERTVIVKLIKTFLESEEIFSVDLDDRQIITDILGSDNDSIENENNIKKAYEVAFAHFAPKSRTQALLALLDFWFTKTDFTPEEKDLINRVAFLSNRRSAEVAIRARKIIMHHQLPSYEKRKLDMEVSIVESLSSISMLEDLVNDQNTLFDVLTSFFFHNSHDLRLASIEIYLRRAYTAYTMKSISNFILPGTERITTMWKVLPPPQADNNDCLRTGILALFQSLEEAHSNIEDLVQKFQAEDNNQNIVQIVMQINHLETLSEDEVDEAMLADLSAFAKDTGDVLSAKGVKRLTFMLVQAKTLPLYYTFRQSLDWEEDRTYRYLEPGLAYQLELYRLKNYDNVSFYPTGNRKQHLYYCDEQNDYSMDRRFFVRSIIHNCDMPSKEEALEYWLMEGEQQILDAISALELASSEGLHGSMDCNHIFLNFLPIMRLEPSDIQRHIWKLLSKHGYRLWQLRVTEGEIRTNLKPTKDADIITIRWYIHNAAGFFQTNSLRCLQEVHDENGNIVLVPLDKSSEAEPLHSPYLARTKIQTKRYNAQRSGTVYVYDIPDLLKEAVSSQWRRKSFKERPEVLISSLELVLDENEELIELDREPGLNNIGMVAWRITMKTTEYPEGRDLVLISNDITHQIGSFGVKEDDLFFKASEYARKLGIPRIYFSANSGARIGLAEEIKSCFKVSWIDPEDASKGFDYLYLDEADYEIHSKSVNAIPIQEEGEIRYKITDVIGSKDGIGVENLKGSGLIAGETSLAYDEIFTLTVTSLRSVGIGAYLVRLGQRVIQLEQSYIILTGAEALNKLLGRKVYSSNSELGGTQIMHRNGVSHLTATDDIDGIKLVVKWLSYIPKDNKSRIPMIVSTDPIDRDVEFVPTELPYDPRYLIDGMQSDNGWISGFFDKGSFMETLTGWALAVVSGRARLGGIPVGVLAVETRMTENEIPPDPGLVDSKKMIVQKAGQVWTPDSSYKTAQSISDINREKLPLIIFANWRGFSGGTQDMYDQVLKFGSYIVDALRMFKQPVIVYIPPHGELRGGSWVVVDPTINIEMMEMYCDIDGKGGILEPEGTVQIKYRVKDIKTTMSRIDPKYQELLQKAEEGLDVNMEIIEYEKKYIPIYQQIAISFAALHDTPGRMKAKDCIRDIIDWKTSRTVLYWRLRRRLIEEEWISKIVAEGIDRSEAKLQIREWANHIDWTDDQAIIEFFEDENNGLQERIETITREIAVDSLKEIIHRDSNFTVEFMGALLASLSEEQRENVLSMQF